MKLDDIISFKKYMTYNNVDKNIDTANNSDIINELKELRYSHERYRIAAENSDEIIFDYNPADGSIYHVTNAVEQLYNTPQKVENALNFFIENDIVQKESQNDLCLTFKNIDAGAKSAECVIKTNTQTGDVRWNKLILTNTFDENGKPLRAIGLLKNITLQKSTEIRYENELLYRQTLAKNALLTYEADLTNHRVIGGTNALFTSTNANFTDNYEDAVDLLVTKYVHENDRDALRALMQVDNLLKNHAMGNDRLDMDYRRLSKDDKPLWVRGTLYLTDDVNANAVKAYLYVQDINDTKTAMLQLKEQAERDLLTGLYNKATTERLVREAVSVSSYSSDVSAFIITDLDNFKLANDNLGHAFGDKLLAETAQVLLRLCGKENIVGRVGGDEFVVFFNNIHGAIAIENKVKQICKTLKSEVFDLYKSCNVSITVGIAIFPFHGRTFEELYKRADVALYEAKRDGKGCYCMYRPELEKQEVTKPVQKPNDNTHQAFLDYILENCFNILCKAQNANSGIQEVMQLLSRQFDFSCCYMYEASEHYTSLTNTCEYIAIGALPMSATLPTINGELFDIYSKRFEKDSVYMLRHGELPPLDVSDCNEGSNLTFRFQHALTGDGHFKGFIGFDQYDTKRPLSPLDITMLINISQLLDIFISRKVMGDKLSEYRVLLDAIDDGINTCTYIINPDTYVLQFVNHTTREVIASALPGSVCYKVLRGESKPCPDCPITKMIESGVDKYTTEMYLPPYELWAKISTTLITMSDNSRFALFNGYDFTKYKDADAALLANADAFTRDAELYNALCNSTDDYIYMCDMPKGLFYFPKNMVEEFDLPGQILKDAINIWAQKIHPNDRAHFFQDINNMMEGPSNLHNQEYRVLNKNGEWVWLRCRGYLERDDKGEPSLFAGILTSLSKKGKIDFVSGLPNKYEFENQARHMLLQECKKGSLLLLGLDNFKNINSLYGWAFGDSVLHQAAQKMQKLLPEDIAMYRLDGDKFGIFLSGKESLGADEIYQLIHAAFQQQQEYAGRRYYCTISCGYSTANDNPPSFSRLFKESEHALEHAKAEGKNHIQIYNAQIMGGQDRMLTLVERLRESIDNNFDDFEVHFQPQLDMITNKIISAEALLRWKCAEYGAISPNEFIPILEQTGLIHAVGRWVLMQAVDTCSAWRNYKQDFTVSVNISFAQLLDKTFVPYLQEMTTSKQLDPSVLHLELTESCISSGSISLTNHFRELRSLGFSIEMDDFGTGYSSLEILKNAPADVVKIDRVFVSDITTSPFDATFIQFVVSLCHSVGIKVCLEGVETWDEFNLVQPMGLDLIQGFLFGRPVCREEFEKRYLHIPSL